MELRHPICVSKIYLRFYINHFSLFGWSASLFGWSAKFHLRLVTGRPAGHQSQVELRHPFCVSKQAVDISGDVDSLLVDVDANGASPESPIRRGGGGTSLIAPIGLQSTMERHEAANRVTQRWNVGSWCLGHLLMIGSWWLWAWSIKLQGPVMLLGQP